MHILVCDLVKDPNDFVGTVENIEPDGDGDWDVYVNYHDGEPYVKWQPDDLEVLG